jgi:hypothetical protein
VLDDQRAERARPRTETRLTARRDAERRARGVVEWSASGSNESSAAIGRSVSIDCAAPSSAAA